MRECCGVFTSFDKAGHNRDCQNSADDVQACAGFNLGEEAPDLMSPQQNQFDADKYQYEGETQREVDQLVEEALQDEIERPEP